MYIKILKKHTRAIVQLSNRAVPWRLDSSSPRALLACVEPHRDRVVNPEDVLAVHVAPSLRARIWRLWAMLGVFGRGGSVISESNQWSYMFVQFSTPKHFMQTSWHCTIWDLDKRKPLYVFFQYFYVHLCNVFWIYHPVLKFKWPNLKLKMKICNSNDRFWNISSLIQLRKYKCSPRIH